MLHRSQRCCLCSARLALADDRAQTSGVFLVVKCCYVHGLVDAECLIGLLPNDWTGKVRKSMVEGPEYRYYNIRSYTETI